MQEIRNMEMMPIKVIVIYLLLTVALYAFGPVEYNTLHPFILYTYLLTSFALLYAGFSSGTKKSLKLYENIAQSNKKQNLDDAELFDASRKSLTIMLIVSAFLLHITLLDRTGSVWFNFGAFKNLGLAYSENFKFVSERSKSYVEWARIILSPITLLYFAIAILSWKKIKMWQKLITVYLIAGNVLLYLTTGVNKGFADAIIYFLVYAILAVLQSDSKSAWRERIMRSRRKLKRVTRIVIIFALIFLAVFSINISSRLQNNGTTSSNGFRYLTSYCTQGYKALDYSFDQPFESTFGFGSSRYLLQSTKNWFNTNYFLNRTYLEKNEFQYGWNQDSSWSSIYVWIGNDVSIWGALIVMFFIGKFYGKIWIEAINKKSIYSVVLCALMTQLCFYIPANNQIVQTTEGLAGLLFMLAFRAIKNGNVKFVIHKKYKMVTAR